MNANVSACMKHLRIRLGWILRDPESILALLFASLATLVIWPGVVPPMGADPDTLSLGMAWIFWVWLWPAIPVLYARGRGMSRRSQDSMFRAPFPALPVGTRWRMAAELAVVLIWVVAVRSAGALVQTAFGSAVAPAALVPLSPRTTLLGCVAVTPALLAWGLPWPRAEATFLASAVVAMFLAVLRQTGLLADSISLVAWCVALSAVLLTLARRDWTWGSSCAPSGRAGPVFRRARPPEEQLARDTWRLPWERFGRVFVVVTALLLVALAIEVAGHDIPFGLYAAVIAFIVFCWWPLAQPFGSRLIADGWAGRQGVRRGAFLKAWSTIPVRGEQVLRRVYLYGLAVAAAMWLVPVAVMVVRSWALYGHPAFRLAADSGSVGELVLPFAALVPCFPALLVAGAVGHTVHTALSAVAVIGVWHGHVLLLALLSHAFPRGSSMPAILDATFVVVLMLLGALPPLIHLRRRRGLPLAV